MLKKFAALFLVVLMSIESFAAVVSDNDGAAFITKAEFDSLKNSFQFELNNINSGIDNKLQSAINGYLEGIKETKIVERSRLVANDKWIMWHSSDYPKYAEGKPFIHGACSAGHNRGSATDAYTGDPMVVWIGINIAGKETYRTNGGFKKHFLEKVKQYKNGNDTNIYAGMYNGYWVDEGEDIVFGGWTNTNSSGYYALEGERYIITNGDNLFQNLALNAGGVDVLPNITLGRTDNGYNTKLSLKCQAAERLVGKKEVGTNICTYDEISDNRFYDVLGQNRVGITETSPPIMRQDYTSTYQTWWNDVGGVMSDAYAVFYVSSYNSSYRRWGNTVAHQAQSYNNITMSSTWQGSSTAGNKLNSYVKMANVPYNIQFKNVWSNLTDDAALATYKYMYAAGPRIKSNMGANIRAALIFDAANPDAPHLSLKAGYPLIEVSKDEKVQWDITTGNKAVNIVAKYGPFQMGNVNPTADADVSFTMSDGSTSFLFNAPANQTSTIKFKAEYDGVVFFKWTTTDSKNAELIVSKNPKVELAEGGTT